MSVRQQKLERLERRIRNLHERELHSPKWAPRNGYRALRWMSMLLHEHLRDDVRIRAESLSFLMLFSILPLIAGVFLVLNVLTQFGLVQDVLSEYAERALSGIPDEQREALFSYVLQFKNQYLASLTGKSSTIGIFALAILIWVGLQTFNNIDRTLNHIWSSERERPFLQKLSNFIVVSVIAPVVVTAALSVPMIARKLPVTRDIFERLPALAPILNYITPGALIFSLFTALYCWVPVAQIRLRSALYGAAFTTVGLQVTNIIMQIYFRFGTNTAYGKLAVLPLLGFWMYLGWVIVILGAEVSFLVQNHRDLLFREDREPSFRETEGFLRVLIHLHRAYLEGKNPVTWEELRECSELNSASLGQILRFATREGLVLSFEGQYALARDITRIPISELLDRFIPLSTRISQQVTQDWQKAISELIRTFENRSVADYSASHQGES